MKVKISSIVEHQFPSFLREESPLLVDALKQYYISGETPGGPFDLISNLDEYTKLQNLTGLVESTSLSEDIVFNDEVITVTSTEGFPDSYGLIKIDSEIITYVSKTDTTFVDCVRGFSGVSNSQLEFSTSESADHTSGATVENLSILFLGKFLEKTKKKLVPGFEGREFTESLNQTTFIEKSKDFYSVKGTDNSFEILFGALYNEPVKVIKPKDYLFAASAAQYRVSKDLVVEALFGDPLLLENSTLYQEEIGQYKKASGAVSKVEKIYRGDKTYYVISLDYDFNKDINVSGSIFGQFSVHPKTQLTNPVASGAQTLEVDSTVGFPASGNLILPDGSAIAYASKSLTQFFGCTGLTVALNAGDTVAVEGFAFGTNGNDFIAVRITGVINEFKQIEQAYHLNVGDVIRPKTLGKFSTHIKTKNWFYNSPVCYNISSLTLLDAVTSQYRIETLDENTFVSGNTLNIVYKNGTIIETTVYSKVNNTSFVIQGQGVLSFSSIDYIEKKISKVNSTYYTGVNSCTANVQNVYEDLTGNVYVAAPSLPSYFGQALEATSREVILTGSFSGTSISYTDHGFLTGDVVIYDYPSTNNLGIPKGTYYVKRNTSNSFSLATSRANLKNGTYVTVTGTVTNNTLKYNDFASRTLQNQKLIRKLATPVQTVYKKETPIGNIGVLNNGVEILNYKSNDAVFYGPIQSIDIISPGSNYDVINPPVIEVTDESGSGLVANCAVKGSLSEIRIVDPGLNYVSEPSISITGGNGTGAQAKAEIGYFDHSVSFNSSSIVSNVIGFSTFHGFNNAEKIIFKPDGVSKVLGISTDSEYFAGKVDETNIRIHNTYSDALSGINTVSLSYSGFAIHRFSSYETKSKISSIQIVSAGENYTNRKIAVPASGINTATDIINVDNHTFATGDVVVYSSYVGSPIVGILTNTSYYVTSLDENNFKLSAFAVAGVNTSSDFYFKTGQFVNLTSSGIGTHYFQDEPINVTLFGISGVTTANNTLYTATVEPVFRGEISSVFVENGGQAYGQEDILNYNRQPNITINSGTDAQIQAIVSNGKIVQVLIINSGSDYNSSPDIIISGTGNGAKITPIVENGQLTEVKIINPGYGYSSNDITLTVVAAGVNGQLRTNPKQWTINLVERLINTKKIASDDGVIARSINSSFGLQYTHAYAPRSYRKTVSAAKFVSGTLRYQPDLQLDVNGREILSDAHSPIVGWAYDGNPIYGPYGFDKETGAVKLIETSYDSSIATGRPSQTLYPEGSFIEDYNFTNSGDLDEYNGRYCITPEFPNGTYAYFTTLSNQGYEGSGPFLNYFKPVFPYFIGDRYKSERIDFNFDSASNQDSIDLNQTGWSRNTAAILLKSSNSFYKYLLQPSEIYEQTAAVTSTLTGSVERVNVTSGGNDYKVGDNVIFDSGTSGGINASARVDAIKGKTVNSISVASTTAFNVEFTTDSQNGIVGFCTAPHTFYDNDTISIKSLNHNRLGLQKSFTAKVKSQRFTLNTDVNVVALTGVTTYFNVYGDLSYPLIRENDVLQIDSEKIKVLNIDQQSSRIFAERGYAGTVAGYHTTGAAISELPRKFFVNTNIQNFTNSTVNRELYFNPSESLGIGIGTTVYFSNPGSGLTSIFVQTRSIYIPNHNLNTGDQLVYNLNGGSEITVSTNGITTSLLTDKTTVYAARYSNDLVGLSTEKVGIGSTGNFVGYNTTSAAKILYFNLTGSGRKHSLVTTYDSTVGQVDKNTVTINTITNPELLINDQVKVSALPNKTQTVKIAYNKQTQRLLANPKNFLSADVDTTNDTIQITGHNFYTGQKILYSANTPISGLANNQIYYVVVVNSDKLSLATSHYDATLAIPNIISFNSSSDGTIFEVNPSINVTKNNLLVFDVSDASLSDSNGLELVSAFDFDIYTDDKFSNLFETSFTDNTFNVIKSGTIGIDSTASVTLSYDENVSDKLFYKLTPRRNNPIFVDNENVNNNTINFTDSIFSGTHNVSGIGSTFFSYVVAKYPEANFYTENVTYTTNSSNASGPIDTVKVTSGGYNYKFLPGISSVLTDNGNGAIFEVLSASIGRINNVNLNDIGFDYSGDLTLIPFTQTPVVVKVVPQTSLERIEVLSPGTNYVSAPSLVLLDGLTLDQITDVDLRYEIGDQEVQIVKNSKGINNVDPIIIPTNNTNGIGINSITYNSTTKDVTITLATSYSSLSDFPFAVGDNVLVEKVSILTDSLAKGYNSSGYNYARFAITSVTPNIGFSNASITYNLSSYLNSGQYPGTFDTSIQSGIVTPEKFFPEFKITLTTNAFLRDEVVTSGQKTGQVMFWNSENELLTISTADIFNSGDVITGSDSLSQGTIDRVYSFDSYYDIDSSSIVRKGWNTETGFMDNEFQRLQDNDYYQRFSYSLKSKVDYSTWNNPVSSLTHIAGFKKFGDLVVESQPVSGLGTTQSSTISDIVIFTDSEVDLNCIDDYDLATENNYLVDSTLGSNQIYFRSRILQDYLECVGNRVLSIDDISSKFDGTTLQFNLNSNSNPIFKRDFNGSNSTIVNLSSNDILIPNHYFTNGEKVSYSHNGSPIGIKTTNVVGVGTTDKLPSTVYVVKYSESTIGLAPTAEDALKAVALPFTFTSVGVGSTHTLTSLNQNSKVLISLGGVLQSPITSTATTTTLSSFVGIGSTILPFDNTSSFASGDYAKIDSEIVKIVTVGVTTNTDVSVKRGWAGTGIATHATNSLIYKISGDYNIVDTTVFFVDPPRGPSPIGTTSGSPEEVDFIGITTTLDFNGRVFLRNGEKNTSNDAYSTNYVFDDISSNFNGISSVFTLKSNNQNVTGFSTNTGAILINSVFQSPSDFEGSYKTYGSYAFEQQSGITTVRFLGTPATQTYDVNGSGLPVGGVIVSIGYTRGFGLQPLVSAGGTAIVSIAGTISAISIGNSGSGYRSGLQVVNVGIYVSTTGISTRTNVGIASISNGRVVSVAITNPGFGYTSTNPPIVSFDVPLPYKDLPLIYKSPSSGIGSGAKVNINVGMGNSITEVEVVNKGFGFKKGDTLTVSIGGTVGIPTISTLSFISPSILVDEIYNNTFSGWTFGALQIIDSIEPLFNGVRKSFPIKIDNESKSIRSKYGSPIDVKSTLLVFINGIMQIPGEGYTFTGSSFITFAEPPKEDFSCLILFYRGTSSTDVVDVDIIDTIKPGDDLKLNDDFGYSENSRLVSKVNTADSVITIPYTGRGVSSDETYTRPVRWCKQTEDLFINQKEVAKDREIYEPIIEPTTNVIKSIGVSTNVIFVESVRTFFDDQRENSLLNYRNKLKIVTQDESRVAIATANVSIAGTVTSINIIDGGVGYTTNPVVSFSNPIGLTTASRAYAVATITSGIVSTITITSPGTGYTSTNPPQIMIDRPVSAFENVTAASLEGDFGLITGIASTSVGVGSTGLVFNLFIPPDSALRNGSIAGVSTSISGIKTDYYFVVKNSFVGNGITSLDETGSIVSIGSSFIDSVYKVSSVSIGQTFVAGIGTTSVSSVTVLVTNNNLPGIGYTSYYGTYSWGRIVVDARTSTNSFNVYNNGIPGVNTSPIVKRVNPLRFKGYT